MLGGGGHMKGFFADNNDKACVPVKWGFVAQMHVAQ